MERRLAGSEAWQQSHTYQPVSYKIMVVICKLLKLLLLICVAIVPVVDNITRISTSPS